MSGIAWDVDKAERNWRRHGVTFAEAATVVRNPLAVEVRDTAHSEDEERVRVLGWSAAGRLLVVVVSRSGDMPRIISARRATKRERDAYVDR